MLKIFLEGVGVARIDNRHPMKGEVSEALRVLHPERHGKCESIARILLPVRVKRDQKRWICITKERSTPYFSLVCKALPVRFRFLAQFNCWQEPYGPFPPTYHPWRSKRKFLHSSSPSFGKRLASQRANEHSLPRIGCFRVYISDGSVDLSPLVRSVQHLTNEVVMTEEGICMGQFRLVHIKLEVKWFDFTFYTSNSMYRTVLHRCELAIRLYFLKWIGREVRYRERLLRNRITFYLVQEYNLKIVGQSESPISKE